MDKKRQARGSKLKRSRDRGTEESEEEAKKKSFHSESSVEGNESARITEPLSYWLRGPTVWEGEVECPQLGQFQCGMKVISMDDGEDFKMRLSPDSWPRKVVVNISTGLKPLTLESFQPCTFADLQVPHSVKCQLEGLIPRGEKAVVKLMGTTQHCSLKYLVCWIDPRIHAWIPHDQVKFAMDIENRLRHKQRRSVPQFLGGASNMVPGTQPPRPLSSPYQLPQLPGVVSPQSLSMQLPGLIPSQPWSTQPPPSHLIQPSPQTSYYNPQPSLGFVDPRQYPFIPQVTPLGPSPSLDPMTPLGPVPYSRVPVQPQVTPLQAQQADQEEAEKLLHQAIEKGFVTSQHVVVILVGIAGSGKSSFKRVVLNLDPEEIRVSTPLAEAAIRNISISRATVSDSDSVIWEIVTSEELLRMLAGAIKEVGVPQKPTEENPSTSAASLSSSDSPTVTSGTEESRSRDLRASASQSDGELVRSKIGNGSSRVQESDEDLLFKDDPLLPLISKSKGSRRLLRVHWVYIIDTGGQPQFLQLLPAFIKNISSCVCLLRLDQDLDHKPLVKYFDKSGSQCGESYPSEHTNLQLIESCVRSIHSRCCVDSDKPPSCFVVGTHLDEYEKKVQDGIETIEEKNSRLLKKLLTPQLKQSLVFYRSGDANEKLVFPLNCKIPEERDHNVAADFRKCVMDRCSGPECKIPLAWFVLEERIRQYAVKRNVAYVERATCAKIASQLHMTTKIFEAALNHLLKLNIFRCYSCLPNLIFCDTQVVLLKLTELVQYSFQLRRAVIYAIPGEDINFKNEAIISIQFLSASRFSSFYSDLFTPKCFLKILRELLAVAVMQEGKFFMPCLLKELSEKEICNHRCSSASLSALLIVLEGGCLPNGLFTSLIAALKNMHGWKLAYEGEYSRPVCLYQNCVSFSLPDNLPGIVTLIASFKYLEVHVNCTIEPLIDNICAGIYRDIKSGLEASWRVLYPGEILFELALFCNSCPSSITSPLSEHLFEFQKHHATISTHGFEKCSVHPKCGSSLSEPKLRWLRSINFFLSPVTTSHHQQQSSSQSCEAGSVSMQQLSSEFNRYLFDLPIYVLSYLNKTLDWDNKFDRDLIEIAKHLVRWEECLASPFRLTPADIHDIKATNQQSPELQRRDVMHKWLDNFGLDATYKCLLEIFVMAKHTEGAKALCRILKNREPRARDVNPYLKMLSTPQLYDLGGELGLNITELRRVSGQELPGELAERWLREDDAVHRTSGTPTWSSLIKALRSQVVGATGVADRIERDKLT